MEHSAVASFRYIHASLPSAGLEAFHPASSPPGFAQPITPPSGWPPAPYPFGHPSPPPAAGGLAAYPLEQVLALQSAAGNSFSSDGLPPLLPPSPLSTPTPSWERGSSQCGYSHRSVSAERVRGDARDEEEITSSEGREGVVSSDEREDKRTRSAESSPGALGSERTFMMIMMMSHHEG